MRPKRRGLETLVDFVGLTAGLTPIVLIVFVLAPGRLGWSAQRDPDVIRCKTLVAADLKLPAANGHSGTSLKSEKAVLCELSFEPGSNNPPLRLGVLEKDGLPFLNMWGTQGQSRIWGSIGSDVGPIGLSLSRKDAGEVRVETLIDGGEPVVSIGDAKKVDRIRLAVSTDALLHLLDARGKLRLFVSANDVVASMGLFDESGVMRTMDISARSIKRCLLEIAGTGTSLS